MIQQHAVDLLRRYFENRHYATTGVGATESYDIRALGADQLVKIEVKGTTSDGAEIVLTYNEVELHRVEHSNNALAIVKNILLDHSGPTAIDGALELIIPWTADRERLRPKASRYQADSSD